MAQDMASRCPLPDLLGQPMFLKDARRGERGRGERHDHAVVPLARTALCGVEGHLRDAATVDADRRQDPARAHALAQPFLARDAVRDRARPRPRRRSRTAGGPSRSISISSTTCCGCAPATATSGRSCSGRCRSPNSTPMSCMRCPNSGIAVASTTCRTRSPMRSRSPRIACTRPMTATLPSASGACCRIARRASSASAPASSARRARCISSGAASISRSRASPAAARRAIPAASRTCPTRWRARPIRTRSRAPASGRAAAASTIRPTIPTPIPRPKVSLGARCSRRRRSSAASSANSSCPTTRCARLPIRAR